MKRLILFFFVFLSLLFSVNSVVLINYSYSNAWDGIGATANWKAQTFNYTSGNYNITQVYLNLSMVGNYTGKILYLNITATNASDNPNNPYYCGGSLSTTYLLNNSYNAINLTGCPTFNGSTRYAMVFYGNGDASNYFRYSYNSTGTYTGGTPRFSSNSGATWASGGTYDISFYITNNTLPTPVTPTLNFTSISLVNNTYFNTSSIQVNTSVLNTSTNGNVNQYYNLYYNNGTFINYNQYAINNLTGIANIGLLNYGNYEVTNNYIYINYSKPSTATSAIWQVKHGTFSTYNITINSICFSQSILQLRFYSNTNDAITGSYGSCYNGTSWLNITNISTRSDLGGGVSNIYPSYSRTYDGNYSTASCYYSTQSRWDICDLVGSYNQSSIYETEIIWNVTTPLNNSLIDGTYIISFYAKNNETNVSSMNYTFTRDSGNPTINNNILSEYNSYNVNFNSSCTDISLVYCNISINGQNVALNTTSFNFTTNGNHSYNITALDLAGNSITSSGVVLINPYQTFTFYDYLRLTNINDFYIDGVLYSNNYTFKTYDYGLGSWNFNFSKEGYINQTYNFTLNNTSNYNETINVTAVTITIKAYDIDTLVQIPFNLTLNGGVIAQYYNQVNFSDYYNNTPQGDVNALISSIGYSDASYNINIGAYSALTLTAYLIPLNDSDLFQFTVLSQDTGAALANVLIEVQELINTSYITASSKLTGDNGKTYFYLDSSKEYKIIFSKDEYVTATAFTIPTVTTYTVKLTGDSTTFNYVNEVSYSFKPSEYLLQNNESYNFIGFISGDSLTSSNFSIVLNNGTTIYTNSNVNPTGTTYNYSYTIPAVANFTQMTMTINYIIDGELFTVSKEYKVITLNEDSFIKTMQNFAESNTEESNLWKWFIVMVSTVLVLISGAFLGTSVPLLIIPLWVFFSFVGWVDFTFTAVISVVALIMFLGGRR